MRKLHQKAKMERDLSGAQGFPQQTGGMLAGWHSLLCHQDLHTAREALIGTLISQDGPLFGYIALVFSILVVHSRSTNGSLRTYRCWSPWLEFQIQYVLVDVQKFMISNKNQSYRYWWRWDINFENLYILRLSVTTSFSPVCLKFSWFGLLTLYILVISSVPNNGAFTKWCSLPIYGASLW